MKKIMMLALAALLVSSGCAHMHGTGSDHHAAHHDLAAKQAAQDTVTRLFVYTDNRDWEKVSDLFAPSVLFDMTSLVGGEPTEMTPQQIVDAWDQGLKPLKAIHHQTGNYLVTLTEDGAQVFCYGIASHYLPNKTNKNTRTFVGSYDFHLVKIDDAWKIDRFKFNLKYLDGNLELESS